MSSLSTLPKGDSAWLLRKSIQRIMQQVSVLETNIGSSTTGNSADTQVIFNDNGTLRGDTGLTYDKNADRLSFGAGICYGLLTSASATITGDLTVDTSTLKVDSANNRVGIGTATPGAYALDVKSTTASAQQRIFGSNQNSITFGNAAGGASNGFLFGRSFSSDDANNLFVYDLTSSALRFFIGNTGFIGIGTAGPTEAFDLNSGNLKLTNGNVVIGTPGKGIDFSATANSSGTMTSELLNDYEEGTWTGTLSGSTAGPTTPVTAIGKYTKIGRQVSIQIAFIAVDTTGASSRILVTGLPFAASSSPNGITGSVLIDAMATFTGSPGVYLTSSSTQIDLYASVSNGAIASVTHNAGAAKSLWLNVTYTV